MSFTLIAIVLAIAGYIMGLAPLVAIVIPIGLVIWLTTALLPFTLAIILSVCFALYWLTRNT
ncbi:hypothetical protein [Sporomusa acidovorans]|uniref:Uncharacterized protein n=1 Tax=Sporomusa acidovorans (strain ATCC 49682 / DSM 3132 / Mol) TaxID=1123286 RepID=A0ABZ3J954_SPOA4|nr:hypothetical protein [Sporomusa acidovorans]OZC22967.1 hypothetical protein SPACI_10400 [Sporomusa acidovorans DSM 3132]SDE93758.1 hypothetical protein SAMN04488499_102713 [Sporomusa acidovorans]